MPVDPSPAPEPAAAIPPPPPSAPDGRAAWQYPNVAPLSLAALCNDTGGDMLYAFQALFLLAILGDDPQAMFKLGLVKSFSLVAGLLILPLSGRLADRASRKGLIIEGYILIVISRAVQGLAWLWWHLLPLAFLKELGRTLRNPAREALLADSVPRHLRGRAFGIFHSMDTFGAILGPLLGLALYFPLLDAGLPPVTVFRWIFLAAAFPTIVSIAIIAARAREIRGTPDERPGEPPRPPPAAADGPAPKGRLGVLGALRALGSLSRSTPHVGRLTLLSCLCALWAAEENFLIACGVKLLGVPVHAVWPMILLYWFINVTLAPTAYCAGRWSDRHNRKTPMVAGYLVLSGLTLGFALLPSQAPPAAGGAFRLNLGAFLWVGLLFGLHGVHQGLLAPSQKVLVAELVPAERRGEALAGFSMCTGLAGILGPVLFGLIWDRWGAATAFTVSGICIAAGAILLALLLPSGRALAPHVRA